MNTYRIDPKEIAEMEPLATGYKIFKDDWTAYGDYPYADEKGTVEGSVHKVEGNLVHCKNGLHFCKNPVDCMKYYYAVQWNKFAKVSAYGDVRTHDDGKSEAQILKIDKILTFDEFVKACKEYETEQTGSGISNGSGIRYGYGIRNGYGISDGYGIEQCKGTSESIYCKDCKGIYLCILCTGESGKYKVFNKQVKKERSLEIFQCIKRIANGWYPKFNTAYDLYEKNDKHWECVPPHKIQEKTAKEAYADMPKELLAYICSLPEFDEKIFKEITGIEV